MSKVYISDTNILIDFRNAGLLEQMFGLPFAFCCTEFVLRELKDFAHAELLGRGLLVETMDEQSIAKLFRLRNEHNNSSLADVSCYLLAQDTGHPLLTGDGRLRRQASSDGLQVRGALWLLDSMLEHGVIHADEAAHALELMLSQGARLPVDACQSRLIAWRKA